MKKNDIRLDEPHVVEMERSEADEASRYGGNFPVKATPLAVGVEYDTTGGHGGRPNIRRDGVRCRLGEPYRVIVRDGHGAESYHEWKPGCEFVVPSRLVQRPWSDDDDEHVRDRALRYAQQDYLRETFTRLGLPETDGSYRSEPGFDLKGGEVVIDCGLLVRWLKRVDPAEVAPAAIDAFVEEVKRREPWAGLADLEAREGEERLSRMRVRALVEVADGLAVADADIEPEAEAS